MRQLFEAITISRGARQRLQSPLHRWMSNKKTPVQGSLIGCHSPLRLWRWLVTLHELVLDHPGNGEVHEPRCREDNEVGGGDPFRHGNDDDPDNYSDCEQRRSQMQCSAIDSGHIYSPSTIFFVYVLCIGAKYRRNEPPDESILLVCKRVCNLVRQLAGFQNEAVVGRLDPQHLFPASTHFEATARSVFTKFFRCKK